MVSLLFISAELSPDDPKPTRVSSISRILAARGHRIFLLCNAGRLVSRSGFGSFLENVIPKVILRGRVVWMFPPALRLPTARGAVKILCSVWNIVSSLLFATMLLALGALRVQAIYSSTPQSQGFIASVVSAFWRIPLIVGYIDPSFARDTGATRKFGSFLESISLSSSDAVISSDPVISQYVYSRCGKKPTLLPNGYDSDLFEPAPSPSRSAARPIIFVGKMDTSVYRLDVLLLACKQVLEVIPEVRLRLIGGGPDIAKLKKLAFDLRLEGSVDYVGFVPHADVASWIRDSEVCVHVTNDTCLGLKVMEYMASGKPIVIAAPWWDKYESVIKSGYNCITVPLEPAALATAILKVMRNRDYAEQLGRNAHETASLYSWNDVCEAMIQVVQALLRP